MKQKELTDENSMKSFAVGLKLMSEILLENKEKIFVIANINTEEGTNVNVPNMFSVLETENIKDISHGYRMDEIPNNFDYYLKPGEVKLFYGKLN